MTDRRRAVGTVEPARRLDRAAGRSPCRHEPARQVAPWTGEPGTAGTVAVVGAGKMGLPLAAQFADPRLARDRRRHRAGASSTRSTRAGRTSARSPGSPSSSRDAHAAGRLRATTDGAAAARDADVVVLIVPVMLDDEPAARLPLHGRGGRRDRARASTPARSSSSRRRCRSATRASGTRRGSSRGVRARRARRRTSSSRSRRSGCTAAPRCATSRPIRSSSAGSAPASTARAAAFYDERARRRGRRDVVGRGGRVLEARRHDLPRRQHRPRQRVRPLRRSDRRRHPPR